jgi:hypothetical protein
MVRHLMRAWDPSSIMNRGALVPADRRVHDSPPRTLAVCDLDEHSLFADLDAELTLDEAENLLAHRGFTLGVRGGGFITLREWLVLGMPGTRSSWEDPVDHALVTLRARVGNGIFQLPPAPRRAVGPDLMTFFVGEGRVGGVERVTLRVHAIGSSRARTLPSGIGAAAAPNAAEALAWENAVEAVRV